MVTRKQKLDFITFHEKRLSNQFKRVVVDGTTLCHTIPGIKEGYVSRFISGFCRDKKSKIGFSTQLHVLSWVLCNKRLPKDKCVVHHTCLNPSCLNPDHLVSILSSDHKTIHLNADTFWL